MPLTAKDIVLRPITAAVANDACRRWHYSGKYVRNSQLHIGAFLGGSLEGVMQFGPSMDKRKTIGLVRGTAWNGFLELNRMAFSDALPRNSESRALAVSMRMIRRHAPHVEWVVSYADATQCGDGTIYRASGFVLTGIKRNTTMLRMPDGRVVARKTLDDHVSADGRWMSSVAKEQGAAALPGFQIRYIYFINKDARARLAVPELPYDAIREAGASMYLGTRAGSAVGGTPGIHSGGGGSNPTSALNTSAESALTRAEEVAA